MAFLTSTVFAIGHIGPPTAELKKGQWDLGFNYSYSTQDLDSSSAKYVWDGDEPEHFKLKTKDFNVHRYYAVGGYGICDRWEVFGQLGVADLKADFEGDDWTDGVNFDNDFAWGLGTRFTLAQQDKVKWGFSAQANWLDTSNTEKGIEVDEVTYTWKEKYSIETFELLLAFGPTIDMGGWKLYGGPFYYYLDGDYEWKESYSDTTDVGKETGDLEEDSNFGGFIGAIVPLAKNVNMTAEFSATADGWGLGTGITFKF
ncbi:MAG: hypothetical protein E4H40_02395 [Candidatus Brocadiia bacterium]|nr:MAG: hypothetical protein E4H40_02395 [Candidatus Brocadiia bacterium]